MSGIEYRCRGDHRGWAHHAIMDGLRARGHEVRVERPQSCTRWPQDSDAAFVWNGAKGRRASVWKAYRDAGKPCFVAERGFFARDSHTQIDAEGFNHTASWSETLGLPAPLEGRGRFEASWGRPAVPVKARTEGHILVLGQCANDAQLRESEIVHPSHLVDALEDATPEGVPISFRCHPLRDYNIGTARRTKTLRGTPLEADIAGARFVVTINSNAGNEALALGCPVLALGPALYCLAGAALQTPLRLLASAVGAMLDGWTPRGVENYLYNLACNQYTLDEFRCGDVLAKWGF